MNFKDAKSVASVVQSLVDSDNARAENRKRINQVFNGDAPYTEAEVEENGISTNVNFLEGTEVLHRARMSFYNAFLKNLRFFTVAIDLGPTWKRAEWGTTISTEIAKAMKNTDRYRHLIRNQFAGVVLHGIGPVTWMRDSDWCPKSHGVEEVLVPSRTLQSLENLPYFAVRAAYTIEELERFHRTGNPRWNRPLLARLIRSMMDKMTQGRPASTPPSPDEPEAWAEDVKENGGFYASDAAPTLRAFEFYHVDFGKNGPTWRRRIIIDAQNPGDGIDATVFKSDEFLYDSKEVPYGSKISEILHVQFADGAVKPPFRWNSTRSLGYLLYSVCHLQNRLRCKFSDAVFESMLWYFRQSSSGDGERLRKVDLHDRGVIPDGLSWVKPEERHQINEALVQAHLSDNRSLISERATSFVRDIDDGTNKEMTAAEATIRAQDSSAMVGSMLADCFAAETAKHIEIARRFCLSSHPECVSVRKRCMAKGVPPEVFKNFEAWDVTTERTMGNGNKILELNQAKGLMEVKDTAEVAPEQRRYIVRKYITALTDDPELALAVVPEDQGQPTPAQQWASIAWGTLISGHPVIIATPMNPIEYITTLLQQLAAEIQRIEAAGGNPPLDKIQGLANVIQHIQEKVQALMVAPAMQEAVKGFEDALGQAGNQVKAYLQRWQEAMQQQGQGNSPQAAEAAAKIQAMLIAAQSKAQIAEENARQKRMHKDMQFAGDQRRKDLATQAEIGRKAAMTQAEIAAKDVTTRAEIIRGTAADAAKGETE